MTGQERMAAHIVPPGQTMEMTMDFAGTLVANGEPFEVTLRGPDGAPVVMFSNSLGTRMEMWGAQAAALACDYRVLCYNPRGFHPQSRADGDFDIALLGQDALAILDELGIAQVHWCGISLGGVIGQWLLLHAPDRLERTVLANTSTWFGGPDGWLPKIAMVRAEGTSTVAEGTAQRVLTAGFADAHPDVVSFVRDMVASAPARAWAGCAAALAHVDHRGRLREVSRPVLVIGGTEDVTTPYAASRELHGELRGSSLVALPSAHLSNLEQPTRFNEVLLAHLRA
ncbi:3-oxoadipate enol-lactonase [Verticiella sediminum]